MPDQLGTDHCNEILFVLCRLEAVGGIRHLADLRLILFLVPGLFGHKGVLVIIRRLIGTGVIGAILPDHVVGDILRHSGVYQRDITSREIGQFTCVFHSVKRRIGAVQAPDILVERLVLALRPIAQIAFQFVRGAVVLRDEIHALRERRLAVTEHLAGKIDALIRKILLPRSVIGLAENLFGGTVGIFLFVKRFLFVEQVLQLGRVFAVKRIV